MKDIISSVINITYNKNEKRIDFISKIEINNITILIYNKSNVVITKFAYEKIVPNVIHWLIPFVDFQNLTNSLLLEFIQNDSIILHKENVFFDYDTALCISGIPRMYDDNIETFYKIKEYFNNIDVFIHAWRNIDNDYNIDRYISLYNPKSILIEDYSEVSKLFNKISQKTGAKVSCISMFYSIYRSNELKKNIEIGLDNPYSYSIRYRTDLQIDFIDFNEIINRLNEFDIVVLKKDDIQNDPITKKLTNILAYPENIISDVFAIGQSKKIDIYSNIFKEFETINSKYCIDIDDKYPEFYITKQLDDKSIKYNNYKCSYKILKR